jgi:hypothetical protein
VFVVQISGLSNYAYILRVFVVHVYPGFLPAGRNVLSICFCAIRTASTDTNLDQGIIAECYSKSMTKHKNYVV